MYPHASPSPSRSRLKRLRLFTGGPRKTTPVFSSFAFPYMKSIPAPTERNSLILNAIVGLTTIVWRSIFVIWFRKMLVFWSLYSCPRPKGAKIADAVGESR